MTYLKAAWKTLMIGFAIYPIIFLGVFALVTLQVFAERLHLTADTIPLLYGLVFAALTFALVDLLGLASVVLALVSGANLIEYAQIIIPGRSASAVDFMASLAGIIGAALLIWLAHSFAHRSEAN